MGLALNYGRQQRWPSTFDREDTPVFPGPFDTVYRNDAGEVLGWDSTDPDETAGLDPYEADYDEGGDEEGCPGHESLDGAYMGLTVYCDGSCL